MKNTLILSIALIFSAPSFAKENKAKPATAKPANSKPWFKTKECTALDVKKFKPAASQKPAATAQLTDAVKVRQLMDKIDTIPSEGDMMVSWGPTAELIELSFKCGSATETVQIYEGQFKTPTTGFNGKQADVERHAYAEIQALLKK